jgi:hypothetical protein
MWPNAIVVVLPDTDHDLCLLQTVEDFALEALVPELAVEAFAIAILPGTARLDIGCSGAEPGQLFAEGLGDHLRAVVAANMFGDASFEHSVGQRLDDTEGVDPSGHPTSAGFRLFESGDN